MEDQQMNVQDSDLAQQWGSMSSGFEESSSGFLSAVGPVEIEKSIDWMRPFDEAIIPLGDYVIALLSWIVLHFRPAFQAIRVPVDYILKSIESGLLWMPQIAMIVIVAFIGWRLGRSRLAIGSVLALIAIGMIGAWNEAMITLALVLTSLFFSIVIGLPLGILAAKSNTIERVLRPVLDAMQTTPAFVYLVPIVMLFGIGNVPGVVVTIIFALPPLVRLTNLGIRQVNSNLIEASHSFGASSLQMLFKVQLPLAKPTIMAGVNQSLMLALSMVVIGSMIAVGGLGQMVLRGIGRLDMGLAAVGGVGIVLLAVVLDRMTQALVKK